MKKLLIAGLSAAVLLATSSVAFAANPTGKVSGFYSIGNYSADGYDDLDYKPFGIKGEVDFGNNFGADASFISAKVGDSESNFSAFDINGTYTVVKNKAGKLDVTVGYISATDEDSYKDNAGKIYDGNYTGFTVGAKGQYDLGNKFSLNGSLAYAPSLTVKADDDELSDYDANALKYAVGVSYEVNKQFTVDAGYQGINFGIDHKNDPDFDVNGFYVGGSVKF